MESKRWTLNSEDWRKAGISALEFFSIPVGFYITAVLGILQLQGHAFNFTDLIPSTLTVNAIVTWAFMQLLGLFKRYNSGSK